MELRQYLNLIRRYFWLIMMGTVLGSAGAYYVTLLMTPIYSAEVIIQIDLAGDPRNTISQALMASEQLAGTYVKQLESETLLAPVAASLGVPAKSIVVKAEALRNTQLVKLSAEAANPVLAQSAANRLIEEFLAQNAIRQQARYNTAKQDLDRQIADLETLIKNTQRSIVSLEDPADPENQNMPKFTRAELTQMQTDLATYQTRFTILLNSAEQFRLAAVTYSDNVTVFAPAELPEEPVKPNRATNTVLGLGVGMMLGAGIALLKEYLDDTLKSPDDVAETLGLVTLGNIFRFHRSRRLRNGLITSIGDRSAVSESYRTLRTNLQHTGLGRESASRCLVVTSASPGEGKTTTASNLAIVMAQAGLQVVLVDADLRRPAIGSLFDLDDSEGLSTMLARPGFLTEANLKATDVPNLRVIPSGPIPPNPAELLSSPRMTELLEILNREADTVIFDSPPILAVTDAGIIAGKAGGAVLVVNAGVTRGKTGLQAREALEKAGAKVLGVVLNRQAVRRDSYYYDYYLKDGLKRSHGRTR